jgi:H+/Cl- antiporter ClcA
MGRIVGAIVGFAIGVLFTEVIFANDQSWPDVVPFALAVLGIVLGSAVGRRFAPGARKPTPS